MLNAAHEDVMEKDKPKFAKRAKGTAALHTQPDRPDDLMKKLCDELPRC